jgi:hypothetical protein
MSSTQKSQHGPGTFELSSKKKFGKNLNKLQKPPAPPITNGTLQKGSESARNGLLLLSTKRSSTTSNLSGSGLLSNRSVQPTTSSGKNQVYSTFQKDSYRSSLDSLNEAFLGSYNQDLNKEPDAWRMAEKKSEVSTVFSSPVSHPEEGSNTREQTHSGLLYQDIEENLVLQNYVSENEDHHVDSFDNDNNRNKLLKVDQNPIPAVTSFRDNFHSALLVDDDRNGFPSPRLEKDLPESSPDEDAERTRDLHILAHHRTREFEEDTGFSPRSKAIPRSLFDPYGSTDATLAGPSKIESDMKEHRLHYPPHKLSATTNIASVNCPVIHLSSYEDLDRGENRSSMNTPRMLYDPKSGSMVSVSDNKTKKMKPRPRREVDAIENGEISNNKKKGKVRNEINVAQRKERRGDSIDSNGADEGSIVKSKEARPMELRFPRTCGVLYLRDEKGNCFSADGCDGDRGYGCHGVPGGRFRNPVAFEKYEIEHQYEGNEGKVDHNSASNKSDSMLQGYATPEVQEPTIDWVKPNERIELLTGIEDSPTLQATAMPWAPRPVFAVASSGKDRSDTLNSVVSAESIDDDDDTEDMCDDLVSLPSHLVSLHI